MEGLRMSMQGARMDDSKPELIRDFMSCGSRAHLVLGNQGDKEMVSNNKLVDCVVQADYPETLDGNFLTLGVGVISEDEAKTNDSSRDFISKIDGAIGTQLNLSHSRSGYGSSLFPDFRMGVGLSDFRTYAGGSSSIEDNAIGLSSLKHNGGVPSMVQNTGESSNVSAFIGSMHNVDGRAISENDLRVADSTTSNFSSSPLQMRPMPQCHVPHPFLTPGGQKFGSGFANIDPNQGFGVSSNVENIRNQSGLPPHQSFHSLSGTSSIVHGSSQSGLPVQQQHRVAPLPSLSSITRKCATFASDQIQKRSAGSIPSLQQGTSVASHVPANIGSTSSQFQSAYLGQSQNRTTVRASNSILFPAYISGGNGPAGAAVNSNLLARLSVKRKAAQPPAVTPQVQMKRTRSAKPSIRSSALYKAQNAPVAHLPPVVSQAPPAPFQAQPISSGNKKNRFRRFTEYEDFECQQTKLLPFAGGNGPAEAAVNSNLLARPSLKRKAAQPPVAMPPVQMKRTRSAKPSIHFSTSYKAQNAPVAPLPPIVSQAAPAPFLAKPKSSAPPVRVSAHPLRPLTRKGCPPSSVSLASPTYPPVVPTTHVPSSARISPPPHIKWQDTELVQLSGRNCLLCKRDLSYTPEGPVFQPAAPPPVAVLSCGHCFHDLCLQRMTPKDQANSPPCIPCVIGES
ncbi:hypothetical protein PTKIN_Ptkin13bG0145800 [Pterospermum kingtungense]